jgi:hypothetical protein
VDDGGRHRYVVRMRVRPALSLTAAALLLVACKSNLERSEIEKIEDSIKDDAKDAGWPVRAVECPSKVKSEKGTTFTCDIRVEDGRRIEATVKLKDGSGRFSWEGNKPPSVYQDYADEVCACKDQGCVDAVGKRFMDRAPKESGRSLESIPQADQAAMKKAAECVVKITEMGG